MDGASGLDSAQDVHNDLPTDIRISRRSSNNQPQSTDDHSELDTNGGETQKSTSVVSSATTNAGVQRVEICFPDLSSAILNARGAPLQNPNIPPPVPAISPSITLRQLFNHMDEEEAEREISLTSPGPPRTRYHYFTSAFRKLEIWTVEDLLLVKADLISCGQSPAQSLIAQLKEACAGDFEHEIPSYPQMARILQRAGPGRI
jgi:hypothetical protein